MKPKHPQATAIARKLRHEASPPERLLWRALREGLPDLHWRRQVPFGSFFVDFASHQARLVVEVDGDYHGFTQDRDAERDRFLREEGYAVLRFPAAYVMGNMEGVMEAIAAALVPSPTPNPSPRGGGE